MICILLTPRGDMELGGNLSLPGRRNQPHMGRTEDQHEACLRPSRCRGNSVRETPENPVGKPNSSNLLDGIPANQSRSPICGQRMHRSISRWITPRSKKAIGHERSTSHLIWWTIPSRPSKQIATYATLESLVDDLQLALKRASMSTRKNRCQHLWGTQWT